MVRGVSRVLVTGSGGLIGSETSSFMVERGAEVLGIDNNLRQYFFGPGGDISGNLASLKERYGGRFVNYGLDLRDRSGIERFFRDNSPFDLIVHAASQPSHDWAAREPFTDFDVNAVATLNLLEHFRKYSPQATFIFTSTNKVYGDNPNRVNLLEEDTRWEYSPDQEMQGVSLQGINEEMSLDNCTHSLFGVSKTAADVLCQEYGRYFGLNVGVFRGGCLTGPQHSAVELHGFLAYIIDCAVKGKEYNIFGYKGKQVRDQIHSRDVVNTFWNFYQNPRKGEAYNLGGTKLNSASILEVIGILDKDFGLKLRHTYVDRNRIGDHICYYTDMSKFMRDFPEWRLTLGLKDIMAEIVSSRT